MMRFDDLVAAVSSLQRSDLEAWIREAGTASAIARGEVLMSTAMAMTMDS